MTTENNTAIADTAPELAQVENESVTQPDLDEEVVDNQETDEQQDSDEEHGGDEFPKKAVNALNRKNKKINKLRAQLRELEAKINEVPKEASSHSEINPDDFENYGDYINAQVESLVTKRVTQSESDMQKQQLSQQKEALKAQRDQYIIEQAQEASQTLQDLPQVWQQNAPLLDALPEQVTDIFYNIDNAPAAIYALAKEGELEGLMYDNPSVAAYKIFAAQQKGLTLLAKPQTRQSQAPTPISKAKGSGTVKKQLTPNDNVLKSLGLK